MPRALLAPLLVAALAVAACSAPSGGPRIGGPVATDPVTGVRLSPTPPPGAPGTTPVPTPEPPSPNPTPVPEVVVVETLPPPGGEPPPDSPVRDPVPPAQTAKPARPQPTPDPATWRVEGVVIDPDGLPVHGVCVAIGPHGCQRGSPRTDGRGVYSIDVPQNPNILYDLHFFKDGFAPAWVRVRPEGPSVYNIALSRS